MDVCVVYMPLHIQLAMAAGSDMEGDSMTQSQSLPSFVHQVSKQVTEYSILIFVHV